MLQNKIQGLTGVSRGETSITLASVLYFFAIICAYYVIKPVRGSLALELGAENMPLLNVLSMLSLVLCNAIYSIIVGKSRREVFIPAITRFFVFCLIVFWVIFTFAVPIISSSRAEGEAVDEKSLSEMSSGAPPTSAAILEVEEEKHQDLPRVVLIVSYFLWVNLYILFLVSMFWSFMNDVFSVEQSRRLYAIIGYGGLIGGLAGSTITSVCVAYIGTASLLLVAAAILYPSIWCMNFIHRRSPTREKAEEGDKLKKKKASALDGLKIVIATPVLICMAFEMFLMTFSSTMFFQHFNQLVEEAFRDDINARTNFVAGMYQYINGISLFTQFFVTRLFMMLPNPVYGLLSLNIVQVIGSLFMLVNPSLYLVRWVIIIRYALDYSTGRALRELVYIPLSKEAKYQGKGFIDTLVFRIGDGMSSIMLIGGISMFSYGSWIDYLILMAMVIQFYVIVKISRLYGTLVEAKDPEETPAT